MAKAKNFRLSERDYDIFEHLARYRLTTRDILHKVVWEEKGEKNAVTKVTSRLVRHGFLNRYELLPSRSYFVVGPNAAALMGIPTSRCKALGEQALAIEIGILDFCCTGKRVRERLRVSQVAQQDPELLKKGLVSSRYYSDEPGENENQPATGSDEPIKRLGYVHVDCGGEAEHVAKKCVQVIEERYKHEAFRRLFQQDRFVVAIVTATEQKRDAILDALRRQHVRSIPFRPHVAPVLAELIFRLRCF